MKKIFFSFYFVLLLGTCFSQTVISGGVVSGNWTKVNSPYLIQGAIMIANSTTLTIEAGVHVEFQGSYKFLVLGQLLAIGTTSDSIFFTANDTATGWLGIRFDNTASTNDSSRFYYCSVQYGKASGFTTENKGGGFYFYNFSKAIISNSTIAYCNSNGAGGGIYCENSSPIICNSSISHNTSSLTGIGNTGGGGGIAAFNSNSIISNNIISYNEAVYNNQSNSPGGGILASGNTSISHNIVEHNYANGYGGGIFCGSGNQNIGFNTISNNNCNYMGGGIGCYQSNAIITHNLVDSNSAWGLGGGIHCEYNSPSITVSDNIVSNNNSHDGAGISYQNNSDGTIINNFISNNTASSHGGGIMCWVSTNGKILNNVICNNSSAISGGGIYFGYCGNIAITNNSIPNNNSNYGGALSFDYASNPTIRNNILWGCTASILGNQVYLYDDNSDPNFYYCDIQGGSATFGLNTNVFYLGNYNNNFNSDPVFTAPSGGSGTGYDGVNADWSLQATSPCINTGDPSGTYPSQDIVGNPRIVNVIIDIGAYESQLLTGEMNYSYSNLFFIYPNPSKNYFTISMNKEMKNAIVEIINSIGDKVYSAYLLGNTTTLDTKLSDGIYFVHVTIGQQSWTKNIIVGQ